MNKLRRKRTDASVIPEGTGELAETIEGLVGLPGDTGVFLAGVWVAASPLCIGLKRICLGHHAVNLAGVNVLIHGSGIRVPPAA